MTLAELFALSLIALHGPGGHEIDINPNEVSSIRDTSIVTEGHFSKDIKCLLFMTNGKVIGVTESCKEVLRLIEEKH
jgi:hypothetical protein